LPFVVTLASVLLAGCEPRAKTVSTAYGGRRGEAASSVNGLSILADMFQRAGYQVTSRSNTGSGINDAQVIVWAPNNFAPPTAEERERIEEWLAAETGRTFVYIGRDYDAGVEYWRRMTDQAKPVDFAASSREAALAESAHDTARSEIPANEDCRWFTVRRDRPRTRVASLSGEWADDLDAEQAEIIVQAQFDVPTAIDKKESPTDDETEEEGDEYDYGDADADTPEFEVLLSTGGTGDDNPFDEEGGFRPGMGTPLVTSVWTSTWGSSELIVVANGSFLFNLPLVNHEHRKLAGRLIERCGDPGKVVFWESSSFRGSSAEQEDEWSVLTTWPLNFILLHLAVLGLLYILWRYPIFGQAYTLRPPATSDFAKHIEALGKLMAATNDEDYARRKLAEYRERVRDK
jgi:hypothetical protein